MPKRVLTDEQQWAILTAPASVPTADLARMVNAGYDVVYAFRRVPRPDGWTCRLTASTCETCGDVLLVPPHSAGQKRHRACRREASRQRQLHQRQTDTTARTAVYDRARDYRDTLAAATAGLDTNRRQPWTDADKQYLLDHRDDVYTMEGIVRLARTLGRSFSACQNMLRGLDAQNRDT